MITRRRFAVAITVGPMAASRAWSQATPLSDRPIHVMVPFPPGGTTDILGRLVAEHLQKAFKQTVVVDNVPGATGVIGTGQVARSAPDGSTLLMASVGTVVTNQYTYEKLPYDPKMLMPVIKIAEIPNVLMVRPDLAVNSAQDLVKLMKAKPGEFKHGSPGIGSSSHISAELFKLQAGVTAIHAPYKGSTPMLTDLMGGVIDFTIDQISSSLALIKGGKIKALAVTSRTRSAQLPDLPTMIESGFKDYEMSPWFCVEAPTGTPRPIVDRINAALNAMLADPEVSAKLDSWGAIASGGSPEDLARTIAREEGVIKEVMKHVDLKAQS